MTKHDVVFGPKVVHAIHQRETVDVRADGFYMGSMVRDKSKRTWKTYAHSDQWEADARLQGNIMGAVKLGYNLTGAKSEVDNLINLSQYQK